MDVLVVEDDPMVRQLLERGLLSEGHTPTVVTTGAACEARLDRYRYDALILDLTLPDMDGIDLARRVRQVGNAIPILMLTARDQLDDRLRGFAVGADDYLVKPFALRELLARLSAITRRAAPERIKRRLTVDDVLLDQPAREVYRGGQLVHLTPKEYSVFELLMEHAGTVISRDAIMQQVWGYDAGGDSNVLETCIKRIRRVIDSDRAAPLIHTVRGAGYKIEPPSGSATLATADDPRIARG